MHQTNTVLETKTLKDLGPRIFREFLGQLIQLRLHPDKSPDPDASF